MSRMKTLTFVALLLGLSACAHFRCPREGGPEWREVTSSHFVVHTDLSEAEARARVGEMELTRAALAAAWAAPQSNERIAVLLPRNTDEMGDFARDDRERQRGFSYEGFFGGQALVLDGSQPAYKHRELKRAIAGGMVEQALRRAPLWFWSGLLDHLESVEVDPATASVLVGAPHPENTYYIQKVGLVPAADVFRWAPDIRYAVGFRESAWGIVHTLLAEHPEESRDLLERLGRGEDPRAATASALARIPAAQLDAETKKELSGASISVVRKPIAPVRDTITSRPLDDGELHAIRAEARYHGILNDARLHGRAGYALGAPLEVADALREDPTQPLALAFDLRATAQDRLARARVAMLKRAQDFRSALLVWALAYQLGADQSDLAAFDLDWLLSRYLATDRAKMTSEMQDAVERAAMLNPDALYPAAGHAAVLLANGDGAQALPAAERALKLHPTSPLLLDLHADALSRNGRCREAADEERLAIAHTADLKMQQGPVFYGHIRATAGEEMLAGMRARLQHFEQACASR